jgi:hypothetical protein
MNQLIRGRAVSGDNTPQGADFANVADQGTRVYVPNGGNFVAIEIKLRGFRGAPVGADLREFADNQRFDMGFLCLFILEVRTNISDVWISEADNLPGVTGVGEYFLISG